MRRGSKHQLDAPGQDSFLDIVANLVGILIILVMVIGARATDAMVSAVPEDPSAEEFAAIDIEASRAAAAAVEHDIHEIDGKIKRQDVEIAYRRSERDKMMQILVAVEDELKSRTSALDSDQQQHLDTMRQLIAARSELEDLKASRQVLENSTPSQNVIEHLPTPMAQTVFGREIHFRLQGGRITYVPWDELVEKLKEDAPHKVWKLKDVPRITETLGPVKGFRMKYTLQQARQVTPVGGGVAVQRRIELDRFVLVPVQDDLGEPLSIALAEVSQFRTILGDFEPNRTTVTFWVYPDSFDDFRQVKADLFRRGYSTAGRPMPEGHPIGGSPDGSRSAAE